MRIDNNFSVTPEAFKRAMANKANIPDGNDTSLTIIYKPKEDENGVVHIDEHFRAYFERDELLPQLHIMDDYQTILFDAEKQGTSLGDRMMKVMEKYSEILNEIKSQSNQGEDDDSFAVESLNLAFNQRLMWLQTSTRLLELPLHKQIVRADGTVQAIAPDPVPGSLYEYSNKICLNGRALCDAKDDEYPSYPDLMATFREDVKTMMLNIRDYVLSHDSLEGITSDYIERNSSLFTFDDAMIALSKK